MNTSKERLEQYASMTSSMNQEVAEMARYILELRNQEPVAMVGVCSEHKPLIWLNDAPAGTLLYAAPAPSPDAIAKPTPQADSMNQVQIYQYQSEIYNEETGETERYWDDCDFGFYSQYAEDRRRVLYAAPVPLASITRDRLRQLVDLVWNDVTESTEVPATSHADNLIYQVFKGAPDILTPAVPDEIKPEDVPDKLPTANLDEYECCVGADMWNACRAAMLQSSPVPPAELELTDEQIDAVLDSRGNIEFVIADKRERLRLFAREILRAAMHNGTGFMEVGTDGVRHVDRADVLIPPEANSPVIPDGWVLVPRQIFLDADDIESICSQCGNHGDYGDYTDGLLWVGDIQDDEGNITYGLHISSADYPEEGGITLAKFADAPQIKDGAEHG